MGRNRMGFRAAKGAAKKSTFKSHRVGSVIMSGKRIISIGWNIKKTHPDSLSGFSQHAEFSACKSLVGLDKRDGLTIYIVRLTRTGRVGMSRPCEDCEALLLKLGINKVVFSNDSGNMEFLRWS